MNRRRQGGFSLLLPALLLLMLAAGLLAGAAQRAEQRSRARTAHSLAVARDALIGYAAAYPELHQRGEPPRSANVPGHLPCPGTGIGVSGQEAPNCEGQGISVVGRLPWKSLGISPLRDGSGECLWYVVAGNYKNNPKWSLLNPDQPGLLHLVDASGRSIAEAAAVVIATGPPIGTQQRAPDDGLCGDDHDARQYLEQELALSSEAGGSSTLTLRTDTAAGNDRYAWITPEDIFTARFGNRADLRYALFDSTYATSGRAALAQRVADCLSRFGLANTFHRLPWAAPLPLPDAGADTFTSDQFDDQKNLLTGRVPQLVRDSFRAVAPLDLPSFATCSSSTPAACRLLRTDNCPDLLPVAGYPTPSDTAPTGKDSPDGWWDLWKDHLFYAVATDFAATAAPAGDCSDPTRCLWVDGDGPYAAVVIFAGSALPGQQRGSDAERMRADNYLEGSNADAISRGTVHFAAAGNDQIVCIRPDLGVVAACGSQHCASAAQDFLAQVERDGCTGAAQTACTSATTHLTGCACYGEAREFTEHACPVQTSDRRCARALRAIRGCGP
jgi:hypothetical protein